MKLLSIVPLCALSALYMSAPAVAEGSAEAGEAKAATCVACHGVAGNSVNPEWPTIAGQHRPYIIKQLKAFKSGARQDPLMTPMATTLTDQDMEDLAAYYTAQTPTGMEADPARVQAGQSLFRGGDESIGLAACAACHGPDGDGNPAALYPAIKAQHATYVAAQLKLYRSGTRQTDQNQMMRNVASNMSDEQIAAVAAYVQGLR
jgi:cytochrome c553